jgi:hypothetical protein
MNRRIFSSFVSLLYVSVALVLGVIHDHHPRVYHPGHGADCAACQWQLQANTDVPLSVVAPVVQVVVFRPVLLPASVPAESPFFSSTASRAPPLAPA